MEPKAAKDRSKDLEKEAAGIGRLQKVSSSPWNYQNIVNLEEMSI